MRRPSRRSTLFLTLTLLLLLSMPARTVARARSSFVMAIAPSWGVLAAAPAHELEGEAEVTRLRSENEMLRDQLLESCDLQRLEMGMLLHLEEVSCALDLDSREPQEYCSRRVKEMERLLQLELCGLPAKVVYRDPAAAGSFLWVDVGRLDYPGRVKKGGAVVVGESLVGMVDYVGRHQSRVRLITDGSLHPSVRAVRGTAQDRRLYTIACELDETVGAAMPALSEQLAELKRSLDPTGRSLYLAKGELVGGAELRWRGGGDLLRGVGFQYDFDDEEGPGRDLRSTPRLVDVGDLLVTTGMDGRFPAGLLVARVVSIAPLGEGASSYDLEARSTAGHLDQISSVLVLPRLDFDFKEVALAGKFPQPNADDHSDAAEQ